VFLLNEYLLLLLLLLFRYDSVRKLFDIPSYTLKKEERNLYNDSYPFTCKTTSSYLLTSEMRQATVCLQRIQCIRHILNTDHSTNKLWVHLNRFEGTSAKSITCQLFNLNIRKPAIGLTYIHMNYHPHAYISLHREVVTQKCNFINLCGCLWNCFGVYIYIHTHIHTYIYIHTYIHTYIHCIGITTFINLFVFFCISMKLGLLH
jgi:hypothetical protein